MKHPTKILLLFILIFLTANSCKKDDDDNPSNDSDNFSEYFKCKINGVEFTTRSDFNCNGKTFYYYPAGAGGLDDGYMLISGRDCSTSLGVMLRIFNPEIPTIGEVDLTQPSFADSISPLVLHIDDDVLNFENEPSGILKISTFTPRDSTTMEFGKIEGTFQFTVSNEQLDSSIHVTEGSFRFKVPNFW
jgi:hypothetical protein